MKVLVTGGTGVIGTATVTELIGRGHQVRLLSRGADDDADAWEGPVEPFTGDVGDAETLIGAAEGCGAVIHITGIADESPPEATFERINVGGTLNVVREAERAGVRRIVYVSSLGVERGESDYHRSKLEGERIVRGGSLPWVIARIGAVMGPGDDTVSVLLRMVRTLPAVPTVGSGDQPFQPVWHEDVAWALVECVDRSDIADSVLRIAGPDVVTVSEVLELFKAVTDRSPVRVPVPSILARAGTALASAVGIDSPVSTATVQLLLEGNHLREDETNDLIVTLGAQPNSTRSRLVELVDDLPEQTLDEGVGRLQRRRFQVDIAGAATGARELLDTFAAGFADVVPFDAAAEPGSPTRLEQDATLTLALPARGHVQVRVESVDEQTVTLATLEGHPLAGIVRFRFQDLDDGVIRFTIDIAERPATRLDQISMALVGSAAQTRAWKQTAENVIRLAGGRPVGSIEEESWDLSDESAESVEEWAMDLVQRRQRNSDNRPGADRPGSTKPA